MEDLHDPYRAIEEMYKAMSDEELWRAMSMLAMYQQRVVMDGFSRLVSPDKAMASLVHSQNSLRMIFQIMLDRSKE